MPQADVVEILTTTRPIEEILWADTTAQSIVSAWHNRAMKKYRRHNGKTAVTNDSSPSEHPEPDNIILKGIYPTFEEVRDYILDFTPGEDVPREDIRNFLDDWKVARAKDPEDIFRDARTIRRMFRSS